MPPQEAVLLQHARPLLQVALFAAPTLYHAFGDLTWAAQVVHLCSAEMAQVSAGAVGMLALKPSCPHILVCAHGAPCHEMCRAGCRSRVALC